MRSKSRYSAFSLVSAIFFYSCSINSELPRCPGPRFLKHELTTIVTDEIKKRGGNPASVEGSRIEIKRSGCDYLYHQVYLPKRPGGYLFVRINSEGRIIEWLPGL